MSTLQTIPIAALLVALFEQMSSGAYAAERWYLMARHGECTEIKKLKRKIPELPDVQKPDAFVKLMREKGYMATSSDIPGTGGKAVEVTVPGKQLSLIFATQDLCSASGSR